MNDLIARVLSGEASDIERRQLQHWRRESPENERTFQEMEHVWKLAVLAEAKGAVPPPPSVETVIAKAEARRRKTAPRQQRSIVPADLLRWAPLAAAAVVLLVVGLVAVRDRPLAVFSTGPDQISTVTLNDGSVVRLGAESSLRVWTADHRTVSLDGTAFFAVASNSAHPFAVLTPSGDAEVLGTRFELRAGGDSLRLVVVEGRVVLDAAGQRVEVATGATSSVIRGSAPTPPRPADVWDLLEWSGGLLIFQSTPLPQVMAEVSSRFGIEIILRDTVLAGRSVTAWFEDETLEEVVTTVCQVVGAKCTVAETVEVKR